MTPNLSIHAGGVLASTETEKKKSRRGILREFQEMRKAMVDEEGLINHAQAGLLLEVSTKRIGELVTLGKLKRFDFLGRTYVSSKQIIERRDMDLKAGRPPRSIPQRLKLGAKTLMQVDTPQIAVMITTEPPGKKKAK
jgi:hypothetical protein